MDIHLRKKKPFSLSIYKEKEILRTQRTKRRGKQIRGNYTKGLEYKNFKPYFKLSPRFYFVN